MAHALENVLAAAAGTRRRDRLSFLFVGPGAERENLINEAKRQKLGNVVFMPPQPKHRMPAVWSLCDVALIHLRNDAVFADVIPSKIFEAMAMGLPLLIVAPDGEATRIIEQTGAGLTVAPEDPVALADAALRLMDDDTLRTRLATASGTAATGFSRRTQAETMMAVLEATAAGRGGEVANCAASAGADEAG